MAIEKDRKNVLNEKDCVSKYPDLYFSNPKSSTLQCFENRFQNGDNLINVKTTEFTGLSPFGDAYYGTIEISYVPDKQCLEPSSLRLYLNSYRVFGGSRETTINTILAHLLEACLPKQMMVKGTFSLDGTQTEIFAFHNWSKEKVKRRQDEFL